MGLRIFTFLVILLLITFCLNFTKSWMKFNSFTAKKRTDLKKRCPNEIYRDNYYIHTVEDLKNKFYDSMIPKWVDRLNCNSNTAAIQVRALRNFDLEAMMGCWYVVQYYASTEELPEYACMRSHFTFTSNDQHITMNFTYIYAEDPLREKLQGNITWLIPEFETPAHWMHTEDIYEGIYNTYVLDTDYTSWSLIMHCAEKNKHPRYLSALLLSREPTLGENVINFLREKLPRYDVDLSFMFSINQTSCDNLMESSQDDPLAYIVNGRKNAKQMFKIILKS